MKQASLASSIIHSGGKRRFSALSSAFHGCLMSRLPVGCCFGWAGGVGLVAGLTRYHTSDPTSWVLNIALTTWNQVNMSVANSLSSAFTVIHAKVEATYRSVLLHDFDPKPIQ